MNLCFEINKDIQIEGLNDDKSTKQAIIMLKNLHSNSTILDIDCEPDMQTIKLAKRMNGKIFSIEIHKLFLDY